MTAPTPDGPHDTLISSLRDLASHLDSVNPLPIPGPTGHTVQLWVNAGADAAPTDEQIARVATWATALDVPIHHTKIDESYYTIRWLYSARRRFGNIELVVSCEFAKPSNAQELMS